MSARTLTEAADIIEGDAIALKEAHTYFGGQWPGSEADMHALYERHLRLVEDLRRMAEELDEADCLLGEEE